MSAKGPNGATALTLASAQNSTEVEQLLTAPLPVEAASAGVIWFEGRSSCDVSPNVITFAFTPNQPKQLNYFRSSVGPFTKTPTKMSFDHADGQPYT